MVRSSTIQKQARESNPHPVFGPDLLPALDDVADIQAGVNGWKGI